MAKFEYKDSKIITDKIEEELVKVEKNSYKYASDNFIEVLDKVAEQEENLNVTSVGENMFYHGIHFLKARGWTEEKFLDAIKNHYHLYDGELEAKEVKD